MATLTISQVKRILGKDAHGMSDADLQDVIDTATLFRDVFFDYYTKNRNRVAKNTQK